MRKIFTLLIALLCLAAPQAKAQLEYKQIGTIKANDYQFRTSYYPVYTMDKYAQGITLYKKDFLGLADGTLIKELTYFGCQNSAKTAVINFTVWVANTTQTTVQPFIINSEPEGGKETTVVDTSQFTKFAEYTWTNPQVIGSYTDPQEILTFTNDQGFTYTGENLVIFVEMNVASGTYPSTNFMTANNGTAGNCIGAYRYTYYNSVGNGVNTKTWNYASGASVKLPVLKVGYAGERIAIPATVKGKVVSSLNNIGIGGATVTLDGQTVTTPSSGLYSFDIEDVDPTKTYTLAVSATGYESASQVLDLKSGGTIEVPNVVLTKLPVPATLQGKVLNKVSGQPVASATVSFNSETVTTDATGAYSFAIANVDALPSDGVTLSANALGYLPYSTTLQLTGDMNMNVQLEPLPALPGEGTLIGQWGYDAYQYTAPFNPLWNYTQQQFIFPTEALSALTNGQKISSVSFYGYYSEAPDPNTGGGDDDDDYNYGYAPAKVEQAPETKNYEVKLYMLNTTQTAYTQGNLTIASTEDLTPLYEGPVSITTSGDQGHPVQLLNLEFDQPFVYEGDAIQFICETTKGQAGLIYFCFDPEYSVNAIGRATSSAQTLENASWTLFKTGLPVVRMGAYIPTGTVAGTVTNEYNQPLESVAVTLQAGDQSVEATTAEDGTYSLSLRGVALGTKYRLSFSLDGYVDDTQDVIFTDSTLDKTIDTVLEKESVPGTITGTVTDADAAPLQGVTVTLADGTSGLYTATTDAQGAYTIDIPNINYDEHYTVNFRLDGYFDKDLTVLFETGMTSATLNAQLDKMPYTVTFSGYVEHETGVTTLPGVSITATCGELTASTLSEANGLYTLEINDAIVPGSYTLTFTLDGYETLTQVFEIDETSLDTIFNASLTKINSVAIIEADMADAPVYSLTGVCVAPRAKDARLTPGIYICAGKKVVVTK